MLQLEHEIQGYPMRVRGYLVKSRRNSVEWDSTHGDLLNDPILLMNYVSGGVAGWYPGENTFHFKLVVGGGQTKFYAKTSNDPAYILLQIVSVAQYQFLHDGTYELIGTTRYDAEHDGETWRGGDVHMMIDGRKAGNYRLVELTKYGWGNPYTEDVFGWTNVSFAYTS